MSTDVQRRATASRSTVSEGTEYVVLRRITINGEPGDAPHGWGEVGRTFARDASAAIKVAHGTDGQPETYIAVPARSWQPVKVTPKVETTLVLEDAS